MPVAPAYSAGGYGGNGSMWGGDWSAWIILFLIWGAFGGGWGNGFGGGFGGANGPGFQGYATRSDINEGFALNGLQNGQTSIRDAVSNGFHGVDTAVCNLGYQTQAGFNALGAQLAQCCCDTQRSIDGVRYDMATQACDTRNTIQSSTRDIIDNANANSRAILDFLTQDKIATLTAENQSLKFQASQAAQNAFITANQEAQTAELIRRINPMPVPAYQVPNPYAGCGCNPCGCGC
ncbi:hypothetical protein EIO64_16885 [Dysosmobacter welbionis]|jgi:hypothetical protein|uniref:Uncharacterized protein n=2 Tax=Dysosmobacter welbionis TaxID=2093857 RepID=A0A4D7AT43_9FIRM|nr:hypothetical protein EIO64_07475 [Dysosmobacter welbionis]QCI61101.1 hypothetical protein EIO64_16885 [Dysosmobacter welbionis]